LPLNEIVPVIAGASQRLGGRTARNAVPVDPAIRTTHSDVELSRRLGDEVDQAAW
jgi:hypothetical protein